VGRSNDYAAESRGATHEPRTSVVARNLLRARAALKSPQRVEQSKNPRLYPDPVPTETDLQGGLENSKISGVGTNLPKLLWAKY
jgi:hypothetical protein